MKKEKQIDYSIGSVIAAIRRKKDIPSGDFAAHLGMSQANYSNVERKKKKISPKMLRRVSAGLGVHPVKIVFESLNPSTEEQRLFSESEVLMTRLFDKIL